MLTNQLIGVGSQQLLEPGVTTVGNTSERMHSTAKTHVSPSEETTRQGSLGSGHVSNHSIPAIGCALEALQEPIVSTSDVLDTLMSKFENDMRKKKQDVTAESLQKKIDELVAKRTKLTVLLLQLPTPDRLLKNGKTGWTVELIEEARASLIGGNFAMELHYADQFLRALASLKGQEAELCTQLAAMRAVGEILTPTRGPSCDNCLHSLKGRCNVKVVFPDDTGVLAFFCRECWKRTRRGGAVTSNLIKRVRGRNEFSIGWFEKTFDRDWTNDFALVKPKQVSRLWSRYGDKPNSKLDDEQLFGDKPVRVSDDDDEDEDDEEANVSRPKAASGAVSKPKAASGAVSKPKAAPLSPNSLVKMSDLRLSAGDDSMSGDSPKKCENSECSVNATSFCASCEAGFCSDHSEHVCPSS